ncbi:hypothetical protein [Streptomyces sp. NPDC000618]|uniref:hypothetical protein n=1 Tax=Streptomyces sp. NPDC000618 TaxID=3154265 RepID=UPI00332469C7
MDSFDHKVVDGFIRTMERSGAGLATQSNAFDKLRAILLDAQRLGVFPDNPVVGVKPRPSRRSIGTRRPLQPWRTRRHQRHG